jgi:amino acid adenylation domain-containing protein
MSSAGAQTTASRPRAKRRAGDDRRVFPLSFAQARLWFLNSLQPSPAYDIPFVTRLPGPLDAKILERALNEIVARHEALRTTFDVVDRKPAQIVAPSLDLKLNVADLRSLPAQSREEEAQRLTFEECRTVFDLAAGPLIRATLIRIAPADHILVLVIHHIVCDGWSIGVLHRELAAIYEAFLARRPSPLPPLTIQYADYAEWQGEWFSGPVLEEQLGYWRKQLAGLAPLLPLPIDRPRPAVQAHRGEYRTFSLDARVCARIKAIGQAESATLFMTTLAAFFVLLHRYTGETDIAVGSPIANRTHQELEGLIGFFVNTLVLRVSLAGDPTFRELLRRVREVALDAYAHQDTPFEKLVEELQPERNAGHNPLFQVMFAVQNIAAPNPAEMTRATAASPAPLAANGTSKFDLTVPLYDTGRTIEGAVEYNTDLFDPETIAELIERFEIVLRGIAYDPDTPISKLPVAAEQELRALENGWSGAPEEPLRFATIGEAVRSYATETPEAVAIVAAEGAVTYAELHARAQRLAAQLTGVAHEEAVVVATSRSVDTLVAFLAVMNAGGAFVPVDPDEPAPRLARILRNAAARVAITDDANADRVTSIDRIIRVSEAAAPDADDDIHAARGGLACILYRSGPGGEPEGVQLTHESLLRIGGGAALAVSAADRVAHASSLLEDSALFELFAPLAAGGTVVILPPSLPPRALADRIREHEITVVFATAAKAERLAREFPWAFRTLRLVLCIDGPAALERLRESFRPEIADRLYGLAGDVECGWYAVQPLTAPAWREDGSAELPIGTPVPGVTLHLLDGNLRHVPPRMCGEIHVAREGLARGYHDASERTAAHFVPDPEAKQPLMLYRTGEHARRTRDGALLTLGRRDGRLRIRGMRVEAAEVRAALLRHDAVKDAEVLVHRDAHVAFVAGDVTGDVTGDEIRSFLKEQLPKSMLPSKIEIVDALPRNAAGGIDRRVLAARAQEADRATAAPRPFVAPRNPLEERLAHYWTEIFGIQRVSIHDNFFEIGGHSLLATQVIARLKDELSADLPLQRLFDAPTIAELAQLLEPLIDPAAVVGTAAPSPPPIVRVPRGKPLPLSFAQQRLWFLDQLEPASAFYNIAVNIPISGDVDLHGLRSTINDLVRRHEPLRTTFTVVGNEPAQMIAPSLTIDVPLTDLSRLEPGERMAEAHRLATIEAQTPFDLRRGPVLRAQVLALSETEHILLLTIHHIATDGWSMDILFRELATLREAHRTSRGTNLPELPIQYADFAVWQRRWLTGEVLDRQLSWWKKELDGAPALLELPADRPRPPVQSFRGSMHVFNLPLSLAHAVRALAEEERATVFMILLAAFDVVLHRYSGRDDLVVGVPIANRTRPELEGLIGFFANTLPVRVRIAPEATFRELLAHVREVTLGAYAHQDIPFEQLVEELQPERSLAYNPIFQVMVALQNIGMPPTDGDASLPPLKVGTGIAKFDLTLFLTEASDRIHCAIEYNTDLFDESTIRRMAGHFETLLSVAVAEPDRALAALPLLRPSEFLELQAWNATAAPFPDECVHRFFERQAARTPDADAVLFGDQKLSYRELNTRANFEAHRLIASGVGTGDLVALSMERGISMIVAVLAVLKSGAAYVPIDPRYPQDRVSLMLGDARVRTFVTALDGTATRDDDPTVAVTPSDRAYVIYTSGSTGRPKGVAMPHRPLANLVTWQIARSALPPGARTLQFTSLSFDVSFQEIFSTLCAGGTLVLIGEDDRRDPAAVWRRIAADGVNRLFMPYAALQQLAEHASRMTELPASLLEVITAGEQLQVTPQIAGLFARLGCPLYNQYGPSETHVVTEHALSGDARQWPALPPIGRPIPNAAIQILDGQRQPVPIGVPGEIHAGGVMLADGYLHDPELTAERFIAGDGAASRLYRTGDRGRFLASGAIEYLGRFDTQVKIRGFRIEPGEIESALRSHHSVLETAVVARDGMLVAYVQAKGATPPGVRELRAHLAGILPEHMMPSAFVLLAELPLTPSGKIDRRSLPDPAGLAVRDAAETFVAPRTPIEQSIAAIWCDLLHLSRVGVTDNFFEIGGQSLLATRMLARVNEELRVDIGLRRVFEQPTVESLAISVLDASLGQHDESAAADLLAQLEALPEDLPSA